MKLYLRIAVRYIFTRRSFHFISIITIISMLGIAVGVAALLSVMSIFNGFRSVTEQQIVGFDPHLRAVPAIGAYFEIDSARLAAARSLPGVISAVPVVQGRAVALSRDNLQVFTLSGISDSSVKYFPTIKKSVIMGAFRLSAGQLPGIVLGGVLADRLRALPGDTITLVSPSIIETSLRSFSARSGIKAIVTGLFLTNIKDYDLTSAFCDFETAGLLLDSPTGCASSIDFRLASLDNAPEVKNAVQSTLGGNFDILTWQDLNRELYRVMRFERMSTFVILSLIILIAVFNLLASLAMTVTEKKRDVGALKAMGADDSLIRKIFIAEGAIVSIIGTLLGLAGGLGFCYGQIYFKWFTIDTSKYVIDSIPVIVRAADVAAVALVSLVLGLTATLYPSAKAAKSIIIEAIRTE